MLIRGVVLLMFICLAAVLFLTAACGRAYAKSCKQGKVHDQYLFRSHTVCAWGAFIIMGLSVVTLECAKVLHGSLGDGQARSIHLLFVVPFVFLFVSSLFVFTGKRVPRMHRWLVYPCLFFFTGAFVAGAAMLLGIAP